MTEQATLRTISGWIGDMADVCSHGADGKPSKQKIALYATMLAADFPAAAFTLASLQVVVRGLEWFPAYDVIRQRVGDYWRENRPAQMAIAGPGNALGAMDAAWERFYYTREREGFGEGLNRPGGTRVNVLSLVKHNSPAAYDAIMARAQATEQEAPEW